MTKVLIPAAATDSTLFAADTDFYVSNLFICAVEGDDAVSVGVKPAGSQDTFWVIHALPLRTNETYTIPSLALSKDDVVIVTAAEGKSHFILTGTAV